MSHDRNHPISSIESTPPTAENQSPSPNPDGIDRRGFLKCMAWAGTGLIWTFAGGVPTSHALGQSRPANKQAGSAADFTFAQISDSHIGFNKATNADVTATLQAALDKISAGPASPDFLIHTGDLTHTSKSAELDTLDQLLSASKRQTFYVPGEHDTSVDDGKMYLDRYGKGSKGNAPIVVFAHIPLWAIYPAWGWGTSDSEQALALLKRFGSVSILNGHIHQVMQKVEGNASFHTAMSTAFPQPAPGTAPSPGPMKVPAEKLRDVLGVTHVNFVAQPHSLAVIDSSLSGAQVETHEAPAS